MTELLNNHWLRHVQEVAASLQGGGGRDPLCFLIGAGASLSSGAPSTAEILEHCQREKSAAFPTADSVYERFGRYNARERDRLIRPLFEDVVPYAGYRCLVALARARPVFVVNLNWDNCLERAGDALNVPVQSFDLKETERIKAALGAAQEDGKGVVCAHVHGRLGEEKGKSDIRFDRPSTHALEQDQKVLLRERFFSNFTVVVGTSLVGPRDVHEMVQALLPHGTPEVTESGEPHWPDSERLWVFERGPHSRAPGFATPITESLSYSLLARLSTDGFVSDPDIDFDLMLSALRGIESGLPWDEVIEAVEAPLPKLEDLVPPNPKVVRPLLDRERLIIVGAPYVGTSTLAHLLGWWRCLTDCTGELAPGELRSWKGVGGALSELRRRNWKAEGKGVIVLDDLFEEPGAAARERGGGVGDDELLRELDAAEARCVIGTSSPDGAAATCGESTLLKVFETDAVGAGTLWRPADLRAWARASRRERAEVVCRRVRLGLDSTPSQAVRTLEDSSPRELEPAWRERLAKHLRSAYPAGDPRALLLAMLRLQDFSMPQPAAALAELANTSEVHLVNDPWGLCSQIEVDGSLYLRLSHPGVVRAVDDWLAERRVGLALELAGLGEVAWWSVQALERWEIFRSIADATGIPDFGADELELFGTEVVLRALQKGERGLALEALKRIWDAHTDSWTAKDVALDLVLHWEELKGDPRAGELRDKLLEADNDLGTYALFEAILRVGRPLSIDLWAAVSYRLYKLVEKTGRDESARKQVALAYDALLWRPCPTSKEEERKLIRILLDAAAEDRLLRAHFMSAGAYHYNGTRRLKDLDFDPPLPRGGEVTRQEAKAMAWVVEWHFVHQSRCRAIASRRTFLSTVDGFVQDGAPRYLDRTLHPHELSAEHREAAIHCVDALLAEEAGWALHLIMNLHATTGSFLVPGDRIAKLGERIDPSSDAVLSAAVTYKPRKQIRELLMPHLETEEGKQALQKRLGAGVHVDETTVCEPRFSMSADPWKIRSRWNASPTDLAFGILDPLELIAEFAGSLESVVASGAASRESATLVLTRMRRGDTSFAEGGAWLERRIGDTEMLLIHLANALEQNEQ